MGVIDTIIGIRQRNRALDQEQRRIDIAQQDHDFQRKIETAKMSMALLGNPDIKPVEGGTYAGTMPTQQFNPMKAVAGIPGAAGYTGGIPDVTDTVQSPTRVPVDPGRTVDWGGKKYAVATPDESFNREVAEKKRLQSAGIEAAVEGEQLRRRMVPEDYVTINDPNQPGRQITVRADRAGETAGGFARLYDVTHPAAKTERRTPLHFNTSTNDAGDVTTVARDPFTGQAISTETRRGAGKRTRDPAGQQMTPGQSAVQNRFDERQFEAAMAKHDKLQDQEQEQHGFRQAYGEALNTQDGQSFIDPDDGKQKDMNSLWRSSLKRRFDQSSQKAKALADQQMKIRKQYGTGEFAPGAERPAEAPQAKQAERPKGGTKINEAELRQRAQAAGKDPDEAVKIAKARKLL